MDVSDQADDEQVNGETEKVSPRRRGIYLAPNLITTGALFAGFYAIVAGMNGNFVAAALAIYVAMLLDTLDGRVARWTRTESRFGAEYDSLSDMVAFGVAPALVAFSWGLDTLGKVGWFCTFVYMACAALQYPERTRVFYRPCQSFCGRDHRERGLGIERGYGKR
jgi:CDP-diacylglycerol--serine O-phosphatidyltransferase